jgi:hypothetical protein
MGTRCSFRRFIVGTLAILLGSWLLPTHSRGAEAPLAHMVFFSLKDRSSAAREKLVASCKKYLSGHAGVDSFSVGVIAGDVEEPVSVRDFDVALHVIFKDRAARDAYLKSARHDQFVAENKESFAKVRVFDSYLSAP